MNEYLNKLEDLEKQIKEAIAEIKGHQDKMRELIKGHDYWIIGADLKPSSQIYNTLTEWQIKAARDRYNIYTTKQEAEFASERALVMRQLDELATNSPGDEWYITYFEDAIPEVVPYRQFSLNSPHVFRSKEETQRAIDIIGVDRLKKYYFMIEDD